MKEATDKTLLWLADLHKDIAQSRAQRDKRRPVTNLAGELARWMEGALGDRMDVADPPLAGLLADWKARLSAETAELKRACDTAADRTAQARAIQSEAFTCRQHALAISKDAAAPDLGDQTGAIRRQFPGLDAHLAGLRKSLEVVDARIAALKRDAARPPERPDQSTPPGGGRDVTLDDGL
jgi:hypothetical protein